MPGEREFLAVSSWIFPEGSAAGGGGALASAVTGAGVAKLTRGVVRAGPLWETSSKLERRRVAFSLRPGTKKRREVMRATSMPREKRFPWRRAATSIS